MAEREAPSGWIPFAAVLMLVVGTLDFFQGLIAIIRDDYYVLTPNQIVLFNLQTWGWITLIWGLIVALAGIGLLGGHGSARWFAIIIACLSIIEQLGFVGSSQYPLWALAVFTMSVFILYALIVRWNDYKEAVRH